MNGALHNALVVILPVGGWVVLLVGGICISSSSTTAPSPSSPLAARFSSSWFYKVVLLGGIHIGPVFLLGSLSLLGITLHTAHISNVLNLYKCTNAHISSSFQYLRAGTQYLVMCVAHYSASGKHCDAVHSIIGSGECILWFAVK